MAKAKKPTLDESNPGIGTWNNWYIGVIIFNVFFILLIAYLFSSI